MIGPDPSPIISVMKRFLLLPLCGLLLAASAAAQEVDSASDERRKDLEARLETLIEETLYSMMRGLPGVLVKETELGEAEGDGGLFERDVNADVELALRTAGIKILTPQELLAHPATPLLYASVMVDEGTGLVGYSIEILLMQTVTLWNGESSVACTWNTQHRGTIDRSNLWRLRERVLSQIDKFANDWLKANPK